MEVNVYVMEVTYHPLINIKYKIQIFWIPIWAQSTPSMRSQCTLRKTQTSELQGAETGNLWKTGLSDHEP